jgi:glutaredoxin-like protein NrdH
MSQITVYTKRACDACQATFRTLNKAGISYQVVDITEDATARDYVMSLGYLQAPVVVTGDTHFSGFRPDRLKALAA